MSKPVRPPHNAVPVFPKGWRVFPCKPGSKEPAMFGWAKEATDDPAQIEAWSIQFPSCNWGLACGPSGLAVIDIDGEIGEQSLFDFELDHGPLPETREHSTPRGGRHLIFAGDIKPTVSKLGPKLDTRGGNSFIVVSPSTFEGKPYTVTQDIPVAPLPQFVADAAGPQHAPKQAAPGTILDTPANIARAKAYLSDLIKRGDVAIEGQGGDARTFALAAELIDRFALTPETTLELMAPWNEASQPPWPYDQLQEKIDNASHYAQNEPGANAVPPVSDRVSNIDQIIADQASTGAKEAPKIEEDKPRRLRFYNVDELIKLPSPRYRVKPWLTTNSDALLYAPKDHVKTFVGFDFCCSIAANIAALGGQYPVYAPGPAFYCLLEGGDTAKFRVIAYCLEHGIDPATLPLHILTVGPIASRDAVEILIAAMKEKLKPGEVPAIAGFDTLSRVLSGLDQNDAGVASGWTRYRSELRAAFPGLTTLTVHHTPVGEPGRPRGAGGFADDADTVLQLSNARKEAKTLHVTLTAEHQRFGASGQIANLAAVEVAISEAYGRDDAGNLFTSLVIHADRAPPPTKSKKTKNEGGIPKTEIELALDAAGAYPGGPLQADKARQTGGLRAAHLGDLLVRRRLKNRQIDGEPTAEELTKVMTDLRNAARECRDLIAYGLHSSKGGNFWCLPAPLAKIEGDIP